MNLVDGEGTAAAVDRGCALCDDAATTVVYSMMGAPVTCATVFSDAAAARAVQRGDIQLRCCDRCGFIYNHLFDPRLGLAGAHYEASQASSQHFGAFARGLAHDWIERYALLGKRVVEVGCGHGEFLEEMVRGGVRDAVGFDPVGDPKRLSADLRDRIEIRTLLFSQLTVAIDADALVCRHTLEHIHQVPQFLDVLHAWARRDSRRVVLFEVPATERILAEGAFWDVYYEHCNYFVKSTLEYAFARAGFFVDRAAIVYDGHYLTLEARAVAKGEPRATPPDASQVVAAAVEFGVRSRRAIERSRAALRKLRAQGRPLVIWQGAAKTIGFMTALGDESLADFAVDVNPHRHRQFLPPHGLQVLAPQELVRLRPKNVVLMNPVYFEEVAATLRSLGLDARLQTVDQLYAE